MTIVERVEHALSSFWAALGAGAGAGIIWLIRTIFTNKKVAEAAQASVEALRSEINLRDAARRDEREAIQRIEERLDHVAEELQRDIKELFKRGD